MTTAAYFGGRLRAALFLPLFALAAAACDSIPSDVKTLVVEDIPDSIPVSAVSEQDLIDGNAQVVFSPNASGGVSVNTENLYIFAVVLPSSVFTSVIDGVLNNTLSPKNIADWGEAFVVAKIQGGTARRRILNLAAGRDDIATYWTGGQDPAYFVSLLYITPDARFILKCDFSVGKYSNTVTEFYYKYSGGDMTAVYEIDGSQTPVPLLSDDFLSEVLTKF